MRFLDTGTGVGKQDDDVAPVTQRLDRQNAAFVAFHGIDRIADQVEEDLHQLISITANAG